MPAADASMPRELLDATGDSGARGEHRRNAVDKITLAAVLGGSEKKHGGGSQMSRTLLDIIADDESQSNKNSWSTFKDRLRRRTGGEAWTSSVHVPTSDVPMRSSSGGHFARQQSTRFPMVPKVEEDEPIDESTRSGNPRASQNRRTQISRMSSTRFPRVTFDLRESTRDDAGESPSSPSNEHALVETEPVAHLVTGSGLAAAMEGDQPPVAAKPPPKMSLLALLEETDRQMGVVGPTYAEPAHDEDDDEDEDEGEDEEGGSDDDDVDDDGDPRRRGEFSCCVCMVSHRGAAFMPCGHTFCRLCSRELWVSRGNCPICNGFILEILNVF